ncbi:hypothetical protein EDD64_106119 [Effusibacillus lacus]|nr:hypothetical protein EDD64_106119 [Effusibacillus lacus]
MHILHCSSCSQLFDYYKKSHCKVCSDSLCTDCRTISSISNVSLCSKHVQQCETCLESAAVDEYHLCTQCNQFCCTRCNPDKICSLCSSLKPVAGITPQINKILSLVGGKVSSKKFEYAEKGNRIALLGKGLMFKDFFVVFDKKEEKIISLQHYGLFNKKK